jgi:hypothetical protein
MDDDTIHNLDSAIAKADPTPQVFDAFRLADSALLHAHAPRLVGCELQDLGFLDVTFDPAVAEGYLSGEHPVLVRITAPAGTRAFPIFQTNDNNESDLLLARGTRFRVLSAEAATNEAPMRLHLEILP